MYKVEHERKFRLKVVPSALVKIGYKFFIYQEQYYLFFDPEMRMRKETYCYENNMPPKYFLTIKHGPSHTGSRPEDEWDQLSADSYDAFLSQKQGHLIQKRRMIYLIDGQHYAVDCYDEPGKMIVIEATFESKEEMKNFVLPSWLEGAVEVTKDPRHKAKNIALFGIPPMPVRD